MLSLPYRKLATKEGVCFDVASGPFKCHFGTLMWPCSTLKKSSRKDLPIFVLARILNSWLQLRVYEKEYIHLWPKLSNLKVHEWGKTYAVL